MKNSLILNPDRCTGCTVCVKACPTEAIRVTRSKAVIYNARCIDCGRCVSVCPHHAYSVRSDSLDRLEQYKYNIIIPDTSFYGQFKNLYDLNIVNEGLLALGFDDVYPAAIGAELLADLWKKDGSTIFEEDLIRVTSECPAVVRLVAMEFQDLIPNVVDSLCAFEVTAVLARQEAVKKTGLSPEEIGIGLISPCPAKNSRVYEPIGLESRVVDYALPMNDIYVKLLSPMKAVTDPADRVRAGKLGLSWGRSGGLSDMFPDRDALAVDGAENVLRILSEIEDEKLTEAELVETALCTQGCFGGCLTVENPFTAKLHMRRLILGLPEQNLEITDPIRDRIPWDYELEEIDTEIADSIAQALQLEAAAERLYKTLPKFDCGNCGAPSCRAFSRDVSEGFAEENDCIFNIIRIMRNGMSHEDEKDELVPPPFRRPL
ncbi:MAG: 4Fe-4S binding protein [Oscillospiraceae bacterium]|nr:4Fe-4S binding protein [Oscillospiraceae bacterium]